jgi:putative flavoprotein involved in K+ transport
MGANQGVGLIEEGAAALELTESVKLCGTAHKADPLDVIVIGAGQAGLSVGYHLARTGVRFLILDANERIGDAWRQRWDSLRLFTPAKFDGLDGMPFPAPRNYYPTKDEMADYLAAYAARFQLPVRPGARVERLFRRNRRYVVLAGSHEFEARQVVVAMAKYQRARIPQFAGELSSTITQLHSSEYRNPQQLQPGGVLLVGAANSGAEIALETARRGHATWLSGQSPGEIPFRPGTLLGRTVLQPLVLRVVFHRLLTVATALGRRVRPAMLHKATPLIRVKSRDLAAAGVKQVSRLLGVRAGQPLLEDGRTPAVANIIWCTGFDGGFHWIDLPVFAADGEPLHSSGIVEGHPGLYFVGLHFLHALSSSMIHGVGRDAARIVDAIRVRTRASGALPAPSANTFAYGAAP